MCDSGRIKHHLKHHLWREQSHIVFIGYQGKGTTGRRIIDGAESIKLFGEEVAIKAHIHTLGGFSAHADQKGLLEWLSHFENPKLEVIVNHGEEKNSIELAQVIQERFHLKASIPRRREKRVLFAPEERPEYGEPVEEIVAPEETLHLLLGHLDRNYKRLRRKLKRWKGMGEETQDPDRLRQLEEVNRRIEELESEL